MLENILKHRQMYLQNFRMNFYPDVMQKQIGIEPNRVRPNENIIHSLVETPGYVHKRVSFNRIILHKL